MARPSLPEDIKKSRVISCKVTPAEYVEIKSTSEKCGISICDFARRRLLGYSPKQRMTDRERAALVELETARTDMRKFAGALKRMSWEDRMDLFGDVVEMHKWLRGINATQCALNKFLKKIKYDS